MPTYDRQTRAQFFQWYDHDSPNSQQPMAITEYVNAPGSSHRCRQTCYTWLRKRRLLNEWGPPRKRRRKLDCIIPHDHVIYLLELLNLDPCQTLLEQSAELELQFGTVYTVQQISAALKHAEYTLKNVEYVSYERNEVIRNHHLRIFRNGGYFSANQLVFIDESHQNEKKSRARRGYGPKGRPLIIRVRRALGLGGANSAICALNYNGMFSVKIVTTEIDGTVDAEKVQEWLVDELLPRMNPYPQTNSVLIMDGASVHNLDFIEAHCNDRGILMFYLPAYSPDMNPIELVFSAVKRKMRKLYRYYPQINEQSVRDCYQYCLWNSCPAEHAVAYFEHCGYHCTDEDRANADEMNNLM